MSFLVFHSVFSNNENVHNNAREIKFSINNFSPALHRANRLAIICLIDLTRGGTLSKNRSDARKKPCKNRVYARRRNGERRREKQQIQMLAFHANMNMNHVNVNVCKCCFSPRDNVRARSVSDRIGSALGARLRLASGETL